MSEPGEKLDAPRPTAGRTSDEAAELTLTVRVLREAAGRSR